jgi:hypothetical protein
VLVYFKYSHEVQKRMEISVYESGRNYGREGVLLLEYLAKTFYPDNVPSFH